MKKGITRLLENDFTEHSHLARGSPVVPNLSNKSSIQMKKSGCDGLNWTQKVNKETIPKRFLILRQNDVGIKLYGAKKNIDWFKTRDAAIFKGVDTNVARV